MSRSTAQNTLKNPARYFLEWKSKEKTWSYYDKEAGERKTIPVDTPFVVLDQLSTATGYSKRLESGFWANEVREVQTDKMVLHNKNGVAAEGTWKEIKGTDRSLKFASSVYAFAKINGEPELVNFKISGCALTPWFDFTKDVKIYDDIAVKVQSTEDHDGDIPYTSPVYGIASRKLSEETATLAKEMDEALQEYLTAYLANSPQAKAVEKHSKAMEAYEAPEAPQRDAEPEPMPEDDVPF